MDEIIARSFAYFAQDPMRVLYALGGAGGVVYWWDRWRQRPHLRLRVRDHGVLEQGPALVLSVENLGGTATSLEPAVVVDWFWWDDRQPRWSRLPRRRRLYQLTDPDLRLPVHERRTLQTKPIGAWEPVFPVMHSVTVRLTRGRRARVRFYTTRRVGLLRWWWYRLRLFAHWIPQAPQITTQSEWEARRLQDDL